MVAWATSLKDGAPLEGVQLELRDAGITGVTAADGTAQLELSAMPAQMLVGQLGDDSALLPRSTYYWDSSGWTQAPLSDELRWYVFDDRAMYRPGEDVHVKGWVRHIGGSQTGDVSLTDLGGGSVSYQVMDPQGNLLTEGTTDLNDLGGFDLAFTIPEGANLGYAQIAFNAHDVGSASNQQPLSLVPDPGVPPAGVRGHGAQRDDRPLLRGRRGRGGRLRPVLCWRAAAQRRHHLERDSLAQQLLAAQLVRFHLRRLGALVVQQLRLWR